VSSLDPAGWKVTKGASLFPKEEKKQPLQGASV
jgi:hypothetical protein